MIRVILNFESPLYISISALSSTHPCGVRPALSNLAKSDLVFQSTHPCGVRHLVKGSTGFAQVSIHAPVWGATSAELSVWKQNKFQSTHPCGVRLNLKSMLKMAILFQSTHPCGVRLATRDDKTPSELVSIHAPVWGATNLSILPLF